MTYAAACTSTLRLGCTVFVTTLHTPVHLAKSLASLDQLSGGRLEVGIGSGGPDRPFAAFGMSGERWLPRFTEGVALMKALWTEPSVTFDGEFWQLKDAAMEPKPYQKPYPRLWFGGSAPAAVRRGVGLCDGFFGAGSSATSAFAAQVAVVRETLAADRGPDAGRIGFGPGEFPIAKRVYLGVDPSSGARARDRTNDALARLYGAPSAGDRVGRGRGHGRGVRGRRPGGDRGGGGDDPVHAALRQRRAPGADRRPDHPGRGAVITRGGGV